jgi:queuine tRNA-ribosyltransferase
MYTLQQQSKKSQARRGVLKTRHGDIQTPFFMPIATKGAVKNLSTEDMKDLQAQIILSNTYHMYLKPGEKHVAKMGGLHTFMQWDGPLLTDSGGYQVFSLAGNKGKKDTLVKISQKGVEFRSHLDGSKHFFTPEKSIQIQQQLGVDIMMAFDVCPPLPAPQSVIEEAILLTARWAEKCKKEWKRGKYGKRGQKLFGIVQGGTSIELRKKSAESLIPLDLSGYAIGGLAVGESREEMYEVLEYLPGMLPENKPRYLMGVGKPEEIVQAVKAGVDMFDCVIPTREARHGRLYVFCKKSDKGAIHLFGSLYYRTLNVSNAEHKDTKTPINAQSGISLLRKYSLGYLHHLYKTEEGLGYRLATLQNLDFYLTLMREIRNSIENNKL